MDIVAIIPARGGSKGVPMKNIKLLDGKPLISHTIQHAKSSKLITKIVVNTDHDEIAKTAKEEGADVIIRPAPMGSDSSEVDPLLQWTVSELEESQSAKISIVVLLYPTAPLRRVDAIDEAIKMVLDKNYDSVLSLYEDQTYLWKISNDIAEPTNYIPAKRAPRQEEGWNQWAENKALYVMKRDLLVDTGCRLGGKIGFVKMTGMQSIDIDTHEDFELCQRILSS